MAFYSYDLINSIYFQSYFTLNHFEGFFCSDLVVMSYLLSHVIMSLPESEIYSQCMTIIRYNNS